MMCGSTDEHNWQESGRYGARVLQEAPHLRQLPPTLDGTPHNTLRENSIGHTRSTRNRSCAETTSEMSKLASACGATSGPGLPLTSVAGSAKIDTRTRSDLA